MRIAVTVPVLMLLAAPGFAQPDPPDISPSVTADRNEASWADWDAQARVTDGDYDGAVQAEHQAETDRREADRQEMLTRSWKR